ncbi:phosphoesterase, MJ0936 family [Desulfosporosinus acidiphilus SJ4]|uniref:Phosphoesterase n=1 Tax=Desulfosporosinus acidiphilus (strain DSM 22704 / JCM 16185 / SJ4) TaxID=646529 RepID=I4D8B2_DESAJ|nr:metallophosphoesterase family protein [Desulfosporosinus acidiphilus]AFM42036.1 phosphoesterase, MJ0936 family [Desulfosporosinus acidiphilus SJ4]
MRIAVLSDTHLKAGRSLPRLVWEHLSDADLILHAGDLTHKELVDELSLVAPVKAVCGNCDDWTVDLPSQEWVECESFKFGIIHGHQGKGKTTLERAYSAFESNHVDVIVFGHSHTPTLKCHNGVLMFNPGSPTDKRREPQYSFGWLEVQEGHINAKHIYF